MNDELEKERLVSAGLREELSVYEEDGNVQWSLKESLIETPAVYAFMSLPAMARPPATGQRAYSENGFIHPLNDIGPGLFKVYTYNTGRVQLMILPSNIIND